MRRKYIAFAVILTLVLATDQLSKAVVRALAMFDNAGVDVIPGLLRVVHAENPGAALSLFVDLPNLLFAAMTVGSAIFVTVWLMRLKPAAWLLPMCLALVLGGAVGNTIDRVATGTVTDFVVLGEGVGAILWGLSWFGVQRVPAFNLADCFLGGGLVSLGLSVLLPGVAEREMRASDPNKHQP